MLQKNGIIPHSICYHRHLNTELLKGQVFLNAKYSYYKVHAIQFHAVLFQIKPYSYMTRFEGEKLHSL